MSGLNALKLVQAKREKANSPQHARRQKLSIKLAEQIQLAKAQQAGTEFAPVRIRSIRDEASGLSRKVEVPKRLKPWWWKDEKGKFCITVRYGVRTLEIVEGKNAIETDSMADVITSLQVIHAAVDAGELDTRIDAAMGKGKSGAAKEPATIARTTLKLPAKP